MNPDEKQKEGVDSWSLLAQELLGEEAAAAPEVESVDAPPVESCAGTGAEERDAQEAADPTDEHASEPEVAPAPDEQREADLSEPLVEAELAEPSGVEMDEAVQSDSQLEADVESVEGLQRDGEDAQVEEPTSEKGKARRSRRGRRRRRSARGADDASADQQPAAAEEIADASYTPEDTIHDLDLDMEEVAVPVVDSDEANAKTKAIPTWAEAISYLSPGPEEAPSNKDGAARPRRRRRRSKS